MREDVRPGVQERICERNVSMCVLSLKRLYMYYPLRSLGFAVSCPRPTSHELILAGSLTSICIIL